jgi:hypothetical protein
VAGLTKQVLETSLKIEMGCAVRLMLDV